MSYKDDLYEGGLRSAQNGRRFVVWMTPILTVAAVTNLVFFLMSHQWFSLAAFVIAGGVAVWMWLRRSWWDEQIIYWQRLIG